MSAHADQISEIRVSGLRSIDRIVLPLSGLTVLAGENGAGKSSMIEACELLNLVSNPEFTQRFNGVHGGTFALLRHGALELRLGVTVEGASSASPLRYDVCFDRSGAVVKESLDLGPYADHKEPLHLIQRDARHAKIFHVEKKALFEVLDQPATVPMLSRVGTIHGFHPGVSRILKILGGIEVHVPFETTPTWVARSNGRQSAPRSEMMHLPAERLERLAVNLANVYSALSTEYGTKHWQETMDLVRLGLGPDVESVHARPAAGGGSIALSVRLTGRAEQIPASALSEGMLAYLAFVALLRLKSVRSLLAFDEPELHLHPGLISRIVGFFERMSESSPVLIATQSDRLLDVLSRASERVLICDLDPETRTTRLRRLDKRALEEWLEDYSGLGALRNAGHLEDVVEGAAAV